MQSLKNKQSGLRLLRKGRKGIFRIVFSRTGLVTVLLLINFFLLFAAFLWLEAFLPHIFGGTVLFTLAMVLYLLNSPLDPTAKLTWLVMILLFPIFGGLLYLFTQLEIGHRAVAKRWRELSSKAENVLVQQSHTLSSLASEAPGIAAMSQYIRKSGCYPVYRDTQVTYFSSGEETFQAMLEELEKAERFIFLEYFIVEEGVMWGTVLEILARKAAQGVEIRVMYDGTCEFILLPRNYPQKLEALGIQCQAFAPVTPFVSTHYNYRDHRKILVIDGHTAFNGGINLADEYINQGSRFGHWKDTAVMLKGQATVSFTLMFLQMWSIGKKAEKWEQYLQPLPLPSQGFVLPYGECPLDDYHTGRQVYIDILQRAQNYVHIMTPYLILDAELENALRYTALRGVEVVLILPGIPDKQLPYALAKAHYKILLDAGVKIYEYTPGFVHAKVFVTDAREAVVGTINLDYRSLYHHFECATYLYRTECIPSIEEDVQNTLLKCRQVSYESIKNEPWQRKALGYILKVVAPLL